MKRFWIPVLLLIFILAGCGGTQATAVQEDQPDLAADADSAEESQPADSPTEDSSVAESTSAPPTEAPAADSAEESSNPAVVHEEFPGVFKLTPLQSIFDCSTGPYFIAGQEYKLSGVCDQWERNYFERPVDEGTTVFFPQLDIVESRFGQDESWYYTRILVFSELVENLVLDGIYAVEIDLDLDARGEILIVAKSPGSYAPDEWHSSGVQIWFDSNDDVGGPQAMLVDPRYDGDGYETLLVDSGVGDDPDLAYVKTYSDQPGMVEFGFKLSLLKGTDIFEWWVWAMKEDLGAAKFDPVDFFPQDSIYALDNTCGWIFGSYPRDLPNICNTIQAPKQQTEGCKRGTPAIVDACYKWDPGTCSWGWDFSCFN